MKLKRFLSLLLVLILLISTLPLAAFASEYTNTDQGNPLYLEPYTDQIFPCQSKLTFPDLYYGITVLSPGLVVFVFDLPIDPDGNPLHVRMQMFQDGSSSIFRERTTASAEIIEGAYCINMFLKAGTYIIALSHDYERPDTETVYDTPFAFGYEPMDYTETEPNTRDCDADLLIPGIPYIGYYDDWDHWVFAVSSDCAGRLYLSDYESLFNNNLGSLSIVDHSTAIQRDISLSSLKTDSDGEKYFYLDLKKGSYTIEIGGNRSTPTLYTILLELSQKLVITKQPSSVKVAPTKKATVSVSATGEGLTYKWYHKNAGDAKFTLAKSMTGKSYSCTMSNSADGRQVYCVITDKYGNSVKTKTVTLSMKFGITKQPSNVTVTKNKTAKVSVSAEGDGLKYQWYYKDRTSKKFKASSTKTSTYSVKMTSSKNGRQVYCVIKDKYGNSVKTKTVTLKMAPKVKITKQPSSSFKVNAGKKVSVTVKASGDGLTYQWYYKNKGGSSYKKISGATSATYSVTMSASVSGRKVYCVVKDKYGQTVKSKTSTLYAKTTVVKQPVSVRVANGKKVTVSVSAAGEKLTYKWYYKNPGSKSFKKASTTKSTYSCTMSPSVNGRQVYCVVKSKYGGSVKTKTVTLSLGTPVSITKQPTSQIALPGTTIKATVAAKGDGLTYKWYAKNKGASKFSYVSSITGASYSVKMSDAVSGRQVYCIITDKYGNKVQTKTVTLSLPSAKQYCGENIFWQIDKNGTMTLTGSGAMYDYELPWDRPYDDLIHSVKKIVVGNGITDLGTNAFYYFDEATAVSLPNTLKTIGREAFSLCGFSSITIPDSVTEIKQWAFQHCANLTTFTIPASVQAIGDAVWMDCTHLNAIKVSSDNPYFSKDSYGVLFNKNKTVLYLMPSQINHRYLMPNTVTKVMPEAMSNAQGLQHIIYRGTKEQWEQITGAEPTFANVHCAVTSGTCGENLTWTLDAKGLLTISGTGPMDENLDQEMTWRDFPEAITSVVIEPGVTAIGNSAFGGCDYLTSVSIPSTVKSIGYEAFFHCPLLKSVVIPNGVSTLNRYTFGGCSSLASIYIPASVKTIEVGAFSSCAKLATVNYGGSSSNWKKISIASNFNEALSKATKKYNVASPA